MDGTMHAPERTHAPLNEPIPPPPSNDLLPVNDPMRPTNDPLQFCYDLCTLRDTPPLNYLPNQQSYKPSSCRERGLADSKCFRHTAGTAQVAVASTGAM